MSLLVGRVPCSLRPNWLPRIASSRPCSAVQVIQGRIPRVARLPWGAQTALCTPRPVCALNGEDGSQQNGHKPPSPKSAAGARPVKALGSIRDASGATSSLQRLWGRMLYGYFNWRQDTWSDLQLFLWLNTLLFLGGGFLQGSVVQRLDPSAVPPIPGDQTFRVWWANIYQVMNMVLGNELPEATAGLASQVFGVGAAVVGLASFALVLTLVEQVVLEVLEGNVKRGSVVYERGHMVVLAWCESARDLGMVNRVLTQICHANRAHGGGTVVVLSEHREKLEMEAIFREAIPLPKRYGTQFVFRQGSPLDPGALRMVAATQARAILVTADYARPAQESDAQCVRGAVLLDELVEEELGQGGQEGPRVVVQAETSDALRVLQYTCSDRVLPVPISTTIAKRIARIIRHPVIAVFSHMLTDFNSTAHGVINHYPQLVGLRFRDLHAYFPYAIVIGLVNNSSGYCEWNPHPNRVVQPGDEVMMMRPGSFEPDAYPPLEHPPAVDMGEWDPGSYAMASRDEQPLGIQCRDGMEEEKGQQQQQQQHGRACRAAVDFVYSATARDAGKPDSVIGRLRSRGLYILPLQYSNTLLPATDLLVCGWSEDALMWELLNALDHGTQPLPPGACVTLLNQHTFIDLRELCRRQGVGQLCVRHVQADPRSRQSLASAVDITQYQAAVVLCDTLWTEETCRNSGAHLSLSRSELLRLDSEVLQVQLNIRLLLQERGRHQINIICESMSYLGRTRFEDAMRLPLGVVINSASFAAKVLTQVAYEPRVMRPYAQLGIGSDMVVQDSSAFAAEGEELSYLQLQARAAAVQQIVMGYYRIPSSPDQPLEVEVNPLGLETRMKLVVWNAGDFRCKIVTMALTKEIQQATIDATSSFSRSLQSSGD